MQNRLQGRIFMCGTFSGRLKDNEVLMGRNPVRVSMPVLWRCTSPICFHKTPKDPHGPFKKDRNQARSQEWERGGRGFPLARLKKVKFALNIKHALFDAML